MAPHARDAGWNIAILWASLLRKYIGLKGGFDYRAVNEL